MREKKNQEARNQEIVNNHGVGICKEYPYFSKVI